MSNLLEKASIVTTPTAYDNGKILSVKPAPSLGSELITNGDFATDLSGWSYPVSGVTWDNGKAQIDALDGAFKYIQQIITTSGTKAYKISFDVSNIQGVIQLIISNNLVTEKSTNGSFEVYYTTSATNPTIQFKRKSGTNTFFELDNVSVKEVIDGDFDFTRNSSATRVNAQGLIEDVQILSSNLVSNGDFSQEGSELITNGDFATNSDWILSGQNLSISNGQGISTGSNFGAQFKQTILQNNKFYKLTFDIVNYSSGSIGLTANYYGEAAQYNSVGTHTAYFTSLSQTEFRLYSQNFIGSIDNVSVKEVGQDWTFGTGWSIEDGKVYFDNPTGTELYQSLSTTASKYRISFDLDITSGTIQTSFSSPSTSTIKSFTTSGTKTVDITTTASFSRFRFVGIGGSVFNIDNVSVVEITDDTNLPRIDYTGGEGHWLFEPQSTNLLTYSEDFDQWSMVEVSTDKNYTSPDGTLNAVKITDNSVNSTHRFQLLTTTASSGNFTYSIFLKKGTMTDAVLNVYSNGTKAVATIDLENGTIAASGGGVNAKIEDYGNDWYRCSIGGTLASTSTTVYLYLSDSKTPYVGNGDFLYVYGAQLEQGTYATSYIPTSGSTVTRLQDAAFGAGSSDLISSTEGVLYAEIAALADDGTLRNISLSKDTVNRVNILYRNGSNRMRFIVRVNNTNVFDTSITLSNITNYNKIALSFKENEFKVYINGVKEAEQLSGSIYPTNTLDKLGFNQNISGGSPFYGKSKCVAVFKEALTDAELTCLTTI